mmetsp:Transcript_892/g.1682  ORF Transcript_892/g.1682 Transcript_892/m.1682 type:complete len:447 (+) Transcript_892:108-1448(+)
MATDRLVELFVQSALAESGGVRPAGEVSLDQQAIENGIDTVEKMLSSEDAVRMGGSLTATFVMLAMALEEKPKLGAASLRCYEKALQHLPPNGGGWERAVVLQQLGAVCLRQRQLLDADRWLTDCKEACVHAIGHPRDANLFGGAFKTQSTRLEFAAMIEKMRAKVCHELGDTARLREHAAEVKFLQAAMSGDAVERQEQAPLAASAARERAAGKSSTSEADHAKALWQMTPKVEKWITEYSFADEGQTVLLILDLNTHLGIGQEASLVIDSLRHFRVHCEPRSADVKVRLKRQTGEVWQFQLLLNPLVKEIVPEDTVPRLRGRPSQRRLEVRFFKRDKEEKWYGDLMSKDAGQKKKGGDRRKPEEGTLLNPLTAEEIARLPVPSAGSVAENRPSGWQGQQLQPLQQQQQQTRQCGSLPAPANHESHSRVGPESITPCALNLEDMD